MEKKNVGMTVEIGKLLKASVLNTIGVKGTAVPANATVVASNVNLAILAMVNGKPFTVTVKPIVTLVNWPAGSNSYFPTVKFSLPAGAKIGEVAVAKTEKVFELEHYRVWNEKEHKYTECRPSALQEAEIIPGALTALNEKLFPQSDLTDRPVPHSDWSAKLSKDFGVTPDKMVEIAKMIQSTPGMTWQSMYIAYANAKKA